MAVVSSIARLTVKVDGCSWCVMKGPGGRCLGLRIIRLVVGGATLGIGRGWVGYGGMRLRCWILQAELFDPFSLFL